MKFEYPVKHDGVLYPVGADVPVDTKNEEELHKEEKPAKGKTTK